MAFDTIEINLVEYFQTTAVKIVTATLLINSSPLLRATGMEGYIKKISITMTQISFTL